MSKTAYHLQLKGFVGGADFDRKAVDNILEKNQGKQVNELIDSTGGNLATGLSITSAFKNHVYVAFYLINKSCSSNQRLMPFFNRSNNEDLILTIQTAEASRVRTGFRKDKSGEKLAESEEDLLEILCK